MAIDKKTTTNPPVDTVTNALKRAADLPRQSNFKVADITARLKPEQDVRFQGMMANVTNTANAEENLSPEEKAQKQYILLSMMNKTAEDISLVPVQTWAAEHRAEIGENFDPNDKIDRSYAEFRRSNSSDRETTARYESTDLSRFYYNPRTHHGARDSGDRRSVFDDGFKIPTYNLDKQQARTSLAADIRTVSEMYAPEAGMSAKDMAKVLGGIATIESRFGVLRSIAPGATKYASSAGGAFHYLDGTIAGEVRQSANDPRIAGRVAQLGVNLKDGVSKSEAWTLKDDNILAGSITAKNIVEAVRKRPDLKNDVAALATYVYQSHNLGEAGANALARGGRAELERVSQAADDNNPMFFRGAKSDAEVNARYTKFVTGAIASSSPLIETAFGGERPVTTLASATPTSKHNLPAPSREPA